MMSVEKRAFMQWSSWKTATSAIYPEPSLKAMVSSPSWSASDEEIFTAIAGSCQTSRSHFSCQNTHVVLMTSMHHPSLVAARPHRHCLAKGAIFAAWSTISRRSLALEIISFQVSHKTRVVSVWLTPESIWQYLAW